MSIRATLFPILACSALMGTVAPVATAQDYMGMAELYGQGVVNSLGTQIRNAGIRSSMGEGGRSAPSATAVWPAHITNASARTHVFTVDEIRAMNIADSVRAGQLLNGQRIRIAGRVIHSARADQSIHLLGDGGEGFHVFASFPGGRGMPQAGARIVLQGDVNRLRRTVLSLRNPQVSNTAARSSVATAAGAGKASAPSVRANYQSLKFRHSAAVTNELAEHFATVLTPALQRGRKPEEIAQLVRGGQLQDAFAELLQPYGFSPADLGDVLASHLVMVWQVANDHAAQLPREHVMAVRENTRESLARAAWVQSMDDADKQRIAEALSVSTMLVAARYVHGHETKRRSEVSGAMSDARQLSQSFSGLDMTRYVLSGQGLTPR